MLSTSSKRFITILISYFYPFTRFHTPVLSIRLSYSVISLKCNVVKTLSEIYYKVNKEGGKKSKSLRTSMEMGTFGAG